ncbi:MAG: aldehyde dehydrogenase family protein, partial [Solirubrobacteraceae bacterium]
MTTDLTAAPSVSHFVGGERTNGSAGGSLDVFNPATATRERLVPIAGTAEIDRAVAGAASAGRAWGRQALAARTTVMFALRSALIEHRDELAKLIVSENGKTFDDARGEVSRGVECVEYACGLAGNLAGSFSREVATGVDVHSIREPLGVVGAITPFNFPVMVPLWMLSAALAAGNAAVLKPSERCPSAPTRMAEILCEAGLPAGVLNVVHGDQTTAEALIAHPGVAAVSFVGSTRVARQVYRKAADAGKRVQALGGAKNHVVVMPDADLASAAGAIIGG